MIKFNAGYVDERQAHLLGFGLSDGNLNRLWLNQPIHIMGNDLGLPPPGAQFIIFAGKNKEQILDRGQLYCESLQKSSNATCLHIDGKFYVIPLPLQSGEMLYLIGLDLVSYQFLRGGGTLSFRCRMLPATTPTSETAELGVNIEANIFWGKTEDALRQSLEQFIGPQTKVREGKS